MKFWNMTTTGSAARLNLYGYIGRWMDIDSREFAQAMREIGDSDIEIYMSSDGGNPITALEIFSMLSRHKGKIVIYNDGIVASAAVIISCVPNATFKMPTGTLLMTHDVGAEMFGTYTAKELRDYADAMETVGMSILEIYAKKTGKTVEELAPYMDGDNYFTAAEAVAAGFADEEIETVVQMAACIDREKIMINGREFDRQRLKNMPERLFTNRAPLQNADNQQPGRSASETEKPKGGNPMDLEKLKAEHPALFQQVLAQGEETGAKKERERIQKIENLAVSSKGHGELVNKAKFAEPMDPGAFAVAMLQAENAKKEKFLQNRTDDANEIPPVGGPDGESHKTEAEKKDEEQKETYINAARTVAKNSRRGPFFSRGKGD